MIGLPYGEKNRDNMLSRFYLIPERYTDRQTDRQTELLYQYRASVCWRAIKIFITKMCLGSNYVALLSSRLRQRERLSASVLSICLSACLFVCLSVCRQNTKTRFSQKLSNLELWCLLTTYRNSWHLPKSALYINPLTYLLIYLLTYVGFSKNPLSDP